MSGNHKLKNQALEELFQAILQLETTEECYEFFEDLCTVTEMQAMGQRFLVARLLDAGESYEEIVAKTGASTATISRVKRCLLYGSDGYRGALDKLYNKHVERETE